MLKSELVVIPFESVTKEKKLGVDPGIAMDLKGFAWIKGINPYRFKGRFILGTVSKCLAESSQQAK